MTPVAAKRVLVTGGSGQVGQALARLAVGRVDLAMPPRAELDLGDADALAAAVAAEPWAAVINAGAYTAVDKAESDVANAWRANAFGPAALAAAAATTGIPILHLSTDYVFDGAKRGFYVEDDAVAPLGVYGASKEGGEQAVRTANPRHIILRTAWVVSPFGSNFVKTMLRLGAERPKLAVVADQQGCPTSALDIAAALLDILDVTARTEAAPYGTYHFVNGGEANWHELASAIFARGATRGGSVPELAQITTAEYPTPARRPANSRLSTAKLTARFGITPRPWQAAVNDIVDELAVGA